MLCQSLLLLPVISYLFLSYSLHPLRLLATAQAGAFSGGGLINPPSSKGPISSQQRPARGPNMIARAPRPGLLGPQTGAKALLARPGAIARAQTRPGGLWVWLVAKKKRKKKRSVASPRATNLPSLSLGGGFAPSHRRAPLLATIRPAPDLAPFGRRVGISESNPSVNRDNRACRCAAAGHPAAWRPRVP